MCPLPFYTGLLIPTTVRAIYYPVPIGVPISLISRSHGSCGHVVDSLYVMPQSMSVRVTNSSHDTRMDRGTLGERSFQYIGSVIWNSLPLSVKLHSLLLNQNWKPTSALLHTELSFSFFSFYQPITSNACIYIFVVCVSSPDDPNNKINPELTHTLLKTTAPKCKTVKKKKNLPFLRPVDQDSWVVCLFVVVAFMLLVFFTKFDP